MAVHNANALLKASGALSVSAKGRFVVTAVFHAASASYFSLKGRWAVSHAFNATGALKADAWNCEFGSAKFAAASSLKVNAAKFKFVSATFNVASNLKVRTVAQPWAASIRLGVTGSLAVSTKGPWYASAVFNVVNTLKVSATGPWYTSAAFNIVAIVSASAKLCSAPSIILSATGALKVGTKGPWYASAAFNAAVAVKARANFYWYGSSVFAATSRIGVWPHVTRIVWLEGSNVLKATSTLRVISSTAFTLSRKFYNDTKMHVRGSLTCEARALYLFTDQLNLGIDPIAGETLLYRSASGLEKAMATVDAYRLTATYAELVRDQWDPYRISYNNLPYLAWSMGANLWEDIWPEHIKRAWTDGQFKFKALRGTPEAFRAALAPSGYDMTDMVRPPQAYWAAPNLTKEQWDDWVRQMPELRIFFALREGERGIDEFFIDRDDAAVLPEQDIALPMPWTATNATLTLGQADPASGSDGWALLEDDTADSIHAIQPEIGAKPARKLMTRIVVYAKPEGVDGGRRLQLNLISVNGEGVQAVFDLINAGYSGERDAEMHVTMNVDSEAIGVDWSMPQAFISTDLLASGFEGNGWYRCELSGMTDATTSLGCTFSLQNDDGAVYDGVSTKGVILYAPSLVYRDTYYPNTTVTANTGFSDQDFSSINDGFALKGRYAVIRHLGVDTPIHAINFVPGVQEGTAIDFVRYSTIGQMNVGLAADADFCEGNNFVDVEEVVPVLYTLRLDRAYSHDMSTLGLSVVIPDLTPLTPRYERNSDVGYGGQFVFSEEFCYDGFVDSEDGGEHLLADRIYLFDPTVVDPLVEGISFSDYSRVGLPSFYSEIQVDLHTHEFTRSEIADASFVDDAFFMPEDTSHIDRALRAVCEAKALRDTILVSFAPVRPAQMGDYLQASVKYADWVSYLL